MNTEEVRDRIAAVCAETYTQAQTPFSFDLQPSGEIDGVFRVEWEPDEVIGGFNFTEERTDRAVIWVARKYHSQPEVVYRRLLSEANSIRAAVIRDGCVTSGEYFVPDGSETVIQREPGREYAVLRVTLPVNYEQEV